MRDTLASERPSTRATALLERPRRAAARITARVTTASSLSDSAWTLALATALASF